MDVGLIGQMMAAGLFLLIIIALMAGYLVAFTLGGLAVLVGFVGIWSGRSTRRFLPRCRTGSGG